MIQNWFDHLDWTLAVRLPAILLAIILHEIAHGLTAKRLGDPTARNMGRLTLNPLPHIDLMGLLMMVVVGFGWAKPVPVDMRYFKKPKRDFALTALAGPMMNFLIAFVALFLMFLLGILWPGLYYDHLILSAALGGPVNPVWLFFAWLTIVSVGLGLFNLFPFPPLDGSKIFGALFPNRIYFTILRYERYGMFLLIALMLLGSYVPSLNIFSWLANVRHLLLGAFQSVVTGFFSLFGAGLEGVPRLV